MSLFIERSIPQIVSSLNEGRISRDDLLKETCERAIKYSKYSVWASFSEEILRKSFEENEEYAKGREKGPLTMLGIPVGVKDIVNTVDYPTQMGSVIWKGFEAGNDARVVYEIKRHGGIVAGKTVTAEFAVHALNETLNPYDVERTPGTSSSGSAVAVALGIVPVAVATQTAGSIIRPSSFCGVFGYVPSFGLIPRTGVLKTTDSLDTMGFITSRVDNIRVFLNAISVKGPDYPFVYRAISDIGRQTRGDRNWRVCFVKTYTWDKAEEYVKSAIEDFVCMLENDDKIDVEERNIDDIIHSAHTIHSTIYEKSLSYYFENEHHDRERVSAVMNEMIERGERITGEEFLKALNTQEEMYERMDELMSQYDAIISISTAGIAPIRNEKEKDDPSLIWTLLHLPAMNIPKFVDSKTSMPFGVQIAGRRFNDGLLIEFAEYLSEKGIIPSRINAPRNEW